MVGLIRLDCWGRFTRVKLLGQDSFGRIPRVVFVHYI
jgi:hypothetical protein